MGYNSVRQCYQNVRYKPIMVSQEQRNKIHQEPENGYKKSTDPTIWGPACWYTLHNMALNYPEKASPICAQKCMNFIRALPCMIPCENCGEHATKFVNDHEPLLPSIASGREPLFAFFVEFHNYVNARFGKRIYTTQEVYNMYTS